MKLRHIALLALLGASLATPAFAQGMGPGAGKGPGMGPCAAQGQGSGMGPGMGPCAAQGMGPGMGPGMGSGMGPGMGRGPGPGASGPGYGPGMGRGWRAGPNNTPGWSMMTPEERAAHQQRMQGMTSRADCAAYVNEQHQQMAARAQQRGASAPAQPRRDMCTGLP